MKLFPVYLPYVLELAPSPYERHLRISAASETNEFRERRTRMSAAVIFFVNAAFNRKTFRIVRINQEKKLQIFNLFS